MSALWVCGACGKHGPTRDNVGDESCYQHAVTVIPESVIYSPDGRVLTAKATPDGGRPK